MTTAPTLSTAPATPAHWRSASAVALLSLIVFVGLVGFAKVKLQPVAAFIPIYQSALVVLDAVTAALLFAQFAEERRRPIFVLACGYLFTGLMIVAHTLTFPGLFSPGGLLGAGPQSTAWLYMLWHGLFPAFVIAYARSGDEPLSGRGSLRWLAVTVGTAAACVLLATAGEPLLPPIMKGSVYGAAHPYVVAIVWGGSLLALVELMRRPRHTALDLWLMVVMCIWISEVALAAVFNGGRFDLGFYAGRIFSLLAASFVLIALLSQYAALAAQAAAVTAALAADKERLLVAQERQQLLEREQAARGEAEVANRTKDEFLAMLGHELRNPLAPIRTALHLMRLRDKTALAKERAIIERQVEHLIRLVDDLLDVSRITKGTILIENSVTDVASVIASALELSSPLIEQRGHHIDLDVAHELWVMGDAARLAQAVSNLLINAAKFTPHGGQIRLSARRHGDQVELSVRDNGLGMTPEAASTIFEPFVQLGPRANDRPQGGLGLGLAIVRSLIRLHGGSVEVSSEGPGLGAEFTVRLPAVDAPGATAAAAATPDTATAQASEPTGSAQILIVDDNIDAANTLAEMIRCAGHGVQVAHDGPQGLKLAAGFIPDVAFLDIGLPVMDGFELARRLRQLPGFDKVTIAAITGYGLEQHREQTAHSGFDAHLVKPVSAQQVFAVIADRASRNDRPADGPTD